MDPEQVAQLATEAIAKSRSVDRPPQRLHLVYGDPLIGQRTLCGLTGYTEWVTDARPVYIHQERDGTYRVGRVTGQDWLEDVWRTTRIEECWECAQVCTAIESRKPGT